jgi:hypothetical protein
MSEARFDWPNPVRGPNYQEMYCNVSQTMMTPWDLSVRLGILHPSSAEGQIGVQELALVTFSPQQFKALALAFANTINAYEERFGAITLNQDLIPSADTIRQAMEEQRRRQLSSESTSTKK